MSDNRTRREAVRQRSISLLELQWKSRLAQSILLAISLRS